MFELFTQGDRSLGPVRRRPWHRADRRQEAGRDAWRTHRREERRAGKGQRIYHPSAGGRTAGGTPAAPSVRRHPRRNPASLSSTTTSTRQRAWRASQLTGHEVATAYSGHEAIGAALAHRPDVVLLDIGLPEMDGYEIARRLRQLGMLHGRRHHRRLVMARTKTDASPQRRGSTTIWSSRSTSWTWSRCSPRPPIAESLSAPPVDFDCAALTCTVPVAGGASYPSENKRRNGSRSLLAEVGAIQQPMTAGDERGRT